MKDRNKTIFRALLIVSAVITLAQTVTLLTHLKNELTFTLIVTGSEIAAIALIIFCILHPEINHKYMIVKNNGKLKFERKKYAPDPEGLRYISSGVAALIISLAFVVVVVFRLWFDIVSENILSNVFVVALALLCIVHSIVESILRKKSKS